jgi:hypothetical protein
MDNAVLRSKPGFGPDQSVLQAADSMADQWKFMVIPSRSHPKKIPAEQYKHASEVDKAEEVLDVVFVANHQAAEVLQPGKQPFDSPPLAVTAQGAP